MQWYQMFYVPFFVLQIKCENHEVKSNSDVIITYTGHAEAPEAVFIPKMKPNATATPSVTEKATEPEPATESRQQAEKDEVVFIPNNEEFLRSDGDEYLHDDTVKSVRIADVMERKKTIDDIVGGHVEETEPPGDIMFISGKNNENVDKPTNQERERHGDARRNGNDYEFRREEKKEPKIVLDCKQLDCNHTVKSVCGGKFDLDRKMWKYRLFLNECFFRKVNCDFKYEENRYKQVSDNKCKNVGGHYTAPTYGYKPRPPPKWVDREEKEMEKVVEKPRRRSNPAKPLPVRRSMNLNKDGNFCSHLCPHACTDDYEPECAVSNTGEKKVFVNHCKLDFSSCTLGMGE